MHSPEQPSSNDFEFQQNQNEVINHDDETNEFRSRKKSDLQHEKVPSDKGNFHRTKHVTFSNYGTQRNYKRSADEAFASTEDTYRRSKWNVKEASSQHKQNTEYSERDTDRKRRRVEHNSQKQGFARLLHSNISRGRTSIRNEYTKHYRRGRSQNVSPLARTIPKDGRSSGNYRARQASRSPWRQRGNHSAHHLRHGRQRQRSSNEYLKTLREYSKKESCEIVMILGTDKHLFEDTIELSKNNTAITFALLCLLDKAFANDLIPTNMLNLIMTIEDSGLITNSVNQLENVLKNKSVEFFGKEEDNFLDAVSCILRIMIRICKLKPSSYTFVEGSNSFIERLMNKILESQKTIQNKVTDIELDMLEEETEITQVESIEATTSSSRDHSDDCAKINDTYESIERLFNEFSDHRLANLSRRERIVKSGDQTDNLEISEDKLTNFRKMSVIPTIEDLHGETDPMLRPIKAKGEYLNIDDYLDVQFRLLREDFVQPLRDGIRAFVGTSTKKTKKKIQEIKIYENVQLESVFYGDGLNHVLSFDISKLRHIRWNMTKRLKYGSLVVLSSDSFQTCYFAVIVNGDAKHLRKGRLHVRFAIDPELTTTLFGVTYVMIETTAYFEAYRPVLKCLQETVDEDLPLGKYILKCENTVSPPHYLSKQTMAVVFDLRCLVDSDSKVEAETYFKIPGQVVPKEQNNYAEDLNPFKYVSIFDKTWTIEDKLSLDHSQLRALKSALTREFSIIQGPPGCGKTFVGLQIAKALLQNRRKWCSDIFSRSQLLVVCYTNHALDQFIEGIQTFFKGDILRVGSRSSNENVMDCSIARIRNKFRKEKAFPKSIYNGRMLASYNLEEIKISMNLIAEKIKILKQNIVREEFLFDEMGSFRDQFKFMWIQRKPKLPWLRFLGDSLIVEWLKIDEMATKIQKDVHFNKRELRVRSDNDIDDTIILEEREKINNTEEEDQTEINEEDFKEKLAQFKSKYLALDLEAIQTCDNVKAPHNKLKKVKLERLLLVEQINHCLFKASAAQIPPVQEEQTNIHRIPLDTRWALYRHWVIRKCEKRNKKVDLESFRQASESRKEALLMEDRHLLKNAHVIGMTTTGAAKYKALLREVKPTIMIVEEAAEVLESHLVSNLTSGCQQLILIGDHKQLKPKPNVYKLETEYNMAISLFERMIRNGLPYDCLQVQHRMRSDIADNIRHIYSTLYDHECVKSYENIQGMKHNAFFINHSGNEHNDSELKSYTNRYEIDFLMALCSYLLLQGYLPSKITILTTYKGQFFLLKKVLMSDFVNLKDVRISTVDNYQGEENDIILLSLVRSNPEGRIGYLARENRICVALSRAKKGMYVIGNFDKLFETSDLWRKIILGMRNKNLCGDILTLMCQNHPNDEGIEIRSPQDFHKAPEGGCGKMCDIRLDCGHTCGKICHTLNKQHYNIECHKPCLKSCFYGHGCQRQCFQECSCDIDVSVLLQRCGHRITMKCTRFETFDEATYMCLEVCNIPLPCGHTCNRKCGEPCICMIPVIKRLQPCNHETEIPCSVNRKKCYKQCEKLLPCGHRCLRKCGEKCEPCTTVVEREYSDCGHRVNMWCGEDLVKNACKKTCNREMDCGHPCPQKCKDDKSYNFQNNIIGSRCAAGHVTNCVVDCKKRLKCGHVCEGNCTLCYQGRWHTKCSEPCNCSLVCGHTCNGTCELCKPCEMPCQRRCSHGICPRLCSIPCFTCPFPCAWECEHYKCTKMCGESCNRDRCNKACRKLLSCNHYCIGMCGDPCPMLCRKCDSQDVKKLIFGKEDEKETRFVQLQDCGHIIRYDIMDEYMDLDEGFSIKRCPICREPIRTSKGNRYEKVLNEFFKRLNALKTYMLNVSDSVLQIFKNDWRRTNEGKLLPTIFGCLPTCCFGFDLLKHINILNQYAVKVFIKNMIRQNEWPGHKADLFPQHEVVMATAQHAQEIENEVRRYLDKCLLEKLHDNFMLSVDDSHNLSKTSEWIVFVEAFSILDKKTAYGDNERFKLQKCIDQLSNVKGTKTLIKISIKPGSKDNMISFSTQMDRSKGTYCGCGSVKRFCSCLSDSSANTKIPELSSREPNSRMWYSIKKTPNKTYPYEEKEMKDLATHKMHRDLVNNDVKSHFSADVEDSNDARNANIETNCETTSTESDEVTNEPLREENIEYVINMVTWRRKPYYECEESKFPREKIRTRTCSNKSSKTDLHAKVSSCCFSPMQSRKRQMDIPADYEREKKTSKLVKHSNHMEKDKTSNNSKLQNKEKLSKPYSDAHKIHEEKSKSYQQHYNRETNVRLNRNHQTEVPSCSVTNLSWKNDTATKSDSVKRNASKTLKESREIVKYEDFCDFKEDPFDKGFF